MAVRDRLSFDYGWRFFLGDINRSPERNYMGTYHAASAESGRGCAAAAYDDQGWQRVDLPHDMLISTRPESFENEDHGYIRRDNGWYRNYFHLEHIAADKRASLIFDGVGTGCIVWVNGVELKRHFTAGTSFEVDFTDVARYGEEVNVVSVYIDNSSFEGWYYEGGGLYRHVWLQLCDPLGIDNWGVFAKPMPNGDDSWTVECETVINNACYQPRDGTLIVRIIGPDGNMAGFARQPFSVPLRERRIMHQQLLVSSPDLWSLCSPSLYTLKTEIHVGDALVDEVDTAFGFRELRFDPNEGFFLNGEHVKIKGMCVHQEHGGLGVALPDGILEYRIRRLMEMGCNAIRTAHNPPAPELLDICDRLGMLVMDENRWLDSTPQGLQELEEMIRRDRNHPSVFMWSMFNEEGAMEYEYGAKIMNAMRAHARKLDDSRPISYAQNTGLLLPGVAETGDLIGINYHNEWYPQLHAMYPDRMLFGAETIGYINGRLNEPMTTWETALKHSYHGGIFAWTGFDYRGEAHWPDVYFRFGAMDPSGAAKDGFHLYQAYWTDLPALHIATTWKHGAELGSPQEIRVYTNATRAELFADGDSLGTRDVDPAWQVKWDFPYRACALTAVAYDADGREIARRTLDNPQRPTRIQIRREEQIAPPSANCRDIMVLNVWALDLNGNICDRAEGALIRFHVEGPVKVLCVGDGDVRDYEPWDSMNCRLRRGHCQLILRANSEPGAVRVTAESSELGGAIWESEIAPGQRAPYVESAENLFISKWYRSPVYEHIAQPEQMLDQDVDGWIPFYTSDCSATHALLTDGCVGFYADHAVPSSGGPGAKVQLLFEQNEYDFMLRIDPDSASGLPPMTAEVKRKGSVALDLPEGYHPGLKVRIRVGMTPRQGRDQLSIAQNVRWRYVNDTESGC